jgi:hypothetical protein
MQPGVAAPEITWAADPAQSFQIQYGSSGFADFRARWTVPWKVATRTIMLDANAKPTIALSGDLSFRRRPNRRSCLLTTRNGGILAQASDWVDHPGLACGNPRRIAIC